MRQMGETTPEASSAEVAWPGAAMTSLVETAQPGPSSVQTAAPVVGRTEEAAPGVSLQGAMVGQASSSASPVYSTTRGLVPEELLP